MNRKQLNVLLILMALDIADADYSEMSALRIAISIIKAALWIVCFYLNNRRENRDGRA